MVYNGKYRIKANTSNKALNLVKNGVRHKGWFSPGSFSFWILVLLLSNRCNYRVYINPSDPLKFFFFFN